MVTKIDQKFTDLLKPIQIENEHLRRDVTTLSDDVESLKQTVALQQGMIDYLRSSSRANRDRHIRTESYSMRENVIISGIQETRGEAEPDPRDTMMELFRDDMSADMSSVTLVRCHRLGMYGDLPRNVLVRFSTHLGKMAVMKSARNLKDREDPIYINDQFPTEVNSQRGTLRPIMQLGKRFGRKYSLVQDKLVVNGKSFTVNNLDKIPFDISHLGTERTDTHILNDTPTPNYIINGLFSMKQS